MALNGHHPWVRFSDRSQLLRPNPAERSYGCAIVDADGDGRPEILCGTVAGPNRLFKAQGGAWVDVAPPELADVSLTVPGVVVVAVVSPLSVAPVGDVVVGHPPGHVVSPSESVADPAFVVDADSLVVGGPCVVVAPPLVPVPPSV